MNTSTPPVVYPDSDGLPLSVNTLQFEWIVTIHGNLDIAYLGDPNVFVAGDYLIYPVEGDADVRQAPDVYVAFGRPKGHRGSYKVFAEEGVFPQVIFEVWSPGNRPVAMEEKRKFYEKYGAEEYYILYPEVPAYVQAWRAVNGKFEPVADLKTWRSPRLGIRFEVHRGHVTIYHVDGTRFLTHAERAEAVEREKLQAVRERARADQEQARADEEKARADRLAEKLRKLGLDPDAE